MKQKIYLTYNRFFPLTRTNYTWFSYILIMMYLTLEQLVEDTSSNAQGEVLFLILEKAHSEKNEIILEISPDSSLASSFLNSSFGLFTEKFGLEAIKEILRLQTNNSQYQRIRKYLDMHNELHGA